MTQNLFSLWMPHMCQIGPYTHLHTVTVITVMVITTCFNRLLLFAIVIGLVYMLKPCLCIHAHRYSLH